MHISVYLGGSWKYSDIDVWFLDHHFLENGKIYVIWGRFQLIFIELETHSVERDIWLIATAQRPNCSYNKGYIAYFYCACAQRPDFQFRCNIWRHRRVPPPDFRLNLDLATRKVPTLKNNHFRVFGMPMLVEIDTLIVRLAHLGPEIWNFIFFKMAAAAILKIGL